MNCPNGWTDCGLCAHLKACESGTYVPEPEPDLNILIHAAEISEKVVQEEAIESAAKIQGDWAEGFSKLGYNDRMSEIYRYRCQGLNYKEPLPPGDPKFSGGSKSGKRRKKPLKKNPFDYLRAEV